MSGAGLGLRLHDLAHGTEHHEAFDQWWPFARHDYLGLDGAEPPSAVTLYYDPILDVHHRVPAVAGMINTLYLAPQVPEDSRVLFDAAAGQVGMFSGDGPVLAMNERATGIALLVARDWGLDEQAARLQAGCEATYAPTWNGDEFWWGFGLDEPYPRGQFNAILAAAEATTPGAWTRFANEYAPYDGPEVCGVDLDIVAITQAAWTDRRMFIGVAPASARTAGHVTTLHVRGLARPSEWRLDGGANATLRTDGPDVVIELPAQAAALTVLRS
jgi:hypothetical protein